MPKKISKTKSKPKSVKKTSKKVKTKSAKIKPRAKTKLKTKEKPKSKSKNRAKSKPKVKTRAKSNLKDKQPASQGARGGKECPSCHSPNLRFDPSKRELTCKKCGLVVDGSAIDFGQEWREFDFDPSTSRRRTGSPSTYTKHDKGMGTSLGSASDLYNLEKGKRRKYYRLVKWQGRISTATERNLKQALAELRRVASYLDISQIAHEEASKIYRMAAEKGLVRGRSMESVVAGALYAACRIHGIPRTLDEIAGAFPLDKKEIGKTYRFICRELGIRILPTLPNDYIYRFSSELGLSSKTIAKAVELIKDAQDKEITSGKGPMGIAAASLYVATLLCNEKRTQREVADVAGVTEVTIRNRYKELLEKLDLGDKLKTVVTQIAENEEDSNESKEEPDDKYKK